MLLEISLSRKLRRVFLSRRHRSCICVYCRAVTIVVVCAYFHDCDSARSCAFRIKAATLEFWTNRAMQSSRKRPYILNESLDLQIC